MADISTLVDDMYKVIKGGGGWTPAVSRQFEETIRDTLSTRLDPKPRPVGTGNLRMSSVGQPCARKLWYGTNAIGKPDLDGPTHLKFLYGDTLEDLLLHVVEAAGHKVEGQQDEMSLFGIKGHRDCVIDGMLVDVKTASPAGFNKFRSGTLPDDDGFGYMTQLALYLLASQDDPLVTNKKEAAFLAIDKVSGELVLDVYNLEKEMEELEHKVNWRKEMVKKPKPPSRQYTDEPDGASGNRKLKFNCAYCDYKTTCWPGVRKFLYANKYSGKKRAVYLSVCKKTPKVEEVPCL